MKDNFKVLNIVLSALVVTSLSVSGVMYYRISSANKALSDLQSQITSKQSDLDAAKTKLSNLNAEIEQKKMATTGDTTDITDLPSADQLTSLGITLGKAQNLIESTRAALKESGTSDVDITKALDELATELGTDMETINSLPSTTPSTTTTTSGTTSTSGSKTTSGSTSTSGSTGSTSSQNDNSTDQELSQAEIDKLAESLGLGTSEEAVGGGSTPSNVQLDSN